MARRRIIARRWNTWSMRDENCTNFVGTENEMNGAFQEINGTKTEHSLQENESDWLV